jgi:hypothetical protein
MGSNIAEQFHELRQRAARLDAVEAESERLRADLIVVWDVLVKARSDIFHWVAIANKQRAEIPNVDFVPCAPTEAGIAESKRLLAEIDAALRGRRPDHG